MKSGERILLTAFGGGFTWGAALLTPELYEKRRFLFPGQGSQYPGMGKDFYEAFPIARETFEEADDLLLLSSKPGDFRWS